MMSPSLFVAAKGGNATNLAGVLASNPNLDVNEKGLDGNTPLHIAGTIFLVLV
jgi:ankyrin repeat protein